MLQGLGVQASWFSFCDDGEVILFFLVILEGGGRGGQTLKSDNRPPLFLVNDQALKTCIQVTPMADIKTLLLILPPPEHQHLIQLYHTLD